MPYIGKEFTHTIESETIGQHYSVSMGEDEESYIPYYQHKEATDYFYADFKELLAQCEELSPVFNDDEKSFTILGSKFYMFCIATQSHYKNMSTQTVSNNILKEYCIRPIIFKEGFLCQPSGQIEMNYTPNNYYNNSNHEVGQNDTVVQHFYDGSAYKKHVQCTANFNGPIFHHHIFQTQFHTSVFSYNSDIGIYNRIFGFDSTGTIITYSLRTTTKYTIHIYYNTNYIYILYESLNGYKIPLGFFILANFKNPNSQEIEKILFTSLYPSTWQPNMPIASNANNVCNGFFSFYNLNLVEATQSVNGAEYWKGWLFNWCNVYRYGHLKPILLENRDNVYNAKDKTMEWNINRRLTFSNYLHNKPTSEYGYFVGLENQFYKVPLSGFNGSLTFDNIISCDAQTYKTGVDFLIPSFKHDTLYILDDETYYAPHNYMCDRYYANKSTTVDMLLKL